MIVKELWDVRMLAACASFKARRIPQIQPVAILWRNVVVRTRRVLQGSWGPGPALCSSGFWRRQLLGPIVAPQTPTEAQLIRYRYIQSKLRGTRVSDVARIEFLPQFMVGLAKLIFLSTALPT